jgi:Holliday junction resolvase RusA-like endonuclease
MVDGGKKVYVKEHVKSYRQLVLYTVKPKISVIYGDKIVRIDLNIYPPDHRWRDIDNLFKCIFDVIQMLGIINNDKQIRQGYFNMNPPIKGGKVDILMEPLAP